MTLADIIDHQFRRVRRALLDQPAAAISPALFTGYSDTAAVVTMASPFTDSGPSKDIAVAIARELLQAKRCTAYTVVSEMWFYSRQLAPGGKIADLDKLPLPSQMPDRLEGLLIYGENSTGEVSGAIWKIERQENGRIREFVKMTDMDRGFFRTLRFGGMLGGGRPN